MSKTSLLLPIYLFSDDISCNLLGYIFAQSASLYALLFVFINIYSFILFILVLGILTLFRDIYYINKFVFRWVQKSKVPPYLKYLLLRDKGWCLQAVRTAGHTLDFTSKPLLVS